MVAKPFVLMVIASLLAPVVGVGLFMLMQGL